MRMLEEFDSVAERIAKLKTSVSRDLNTRRHLGAILGQRSAEIFKAFDKKRDMRFRSVAVGIVFRPDVQLPLSDGKPESAAAGEFGRLFDLAKAKNAAIKIPGAFFGTFRDGDLRMMDREDHVCPSSFSRIRVSTKSGI